MTKTMYVAIRLIALWVIFVASVGMMFWAGMHFTIATVKMANGSYQDTSCPNGYCPMAMTLTSCIMAPPYPAAPMMGESEFGPDKGSMDQYNKEYEKYTQQYQEACKQDVMRQQGVQKNSALVDIVGYGILLLFGVLAGGMSMMAIKRAEEANV